MLAKHFTTRHLRAESQAGAPPQHLLRLTAQPPILCQLSPPQFTATGFNGTIVRDASKLVCHARRAYSNEDPDPRRSSSGYKTVDINLGGTRITVTEGNLWSLAIPGLMVLGLAALIGPLVIGVAMTAVAVGAAMSLGAFALSTVFWLPLVAMFGFLSFFFFPFGMFATFGLGLLLPKVMSLAVALGGVALGWSVVSKFLPQQSSSSAQSMGNIWEAGRNAGSSNSDRPGVDDGPVVQASSRSLDPEDEAEARRRSDELYEFDKMMADRDARKRMDDWRKERL